MKYSKGLTIHTVLSVTLTVVGASAGDQASGTTAAAVVFKQTETSVRRTTTTTTPESAETTPETITRPPDTGISTGNAASELTEELHVRLGPTETADCVRRSRVTGRRSPGTDTFESHVTRVTQFHKELRALKGSIQWEVTADQLKNLLPSGVTSFCAVLVRVPSGFHAVVKVTEKIGSDLVLYDARCRHYVRDDFKATDQNEGIAEVFVGDANTVTILLNLQGTGAFSLIRFQALESPDFQVRRTGLNTGIVETPLAERHENSVLVTPLSQPRASVRAPSGHVIMASSPDFETRFGCLALRDGDRGNATLAKVCEGMTVSGLGKLPPPAAAVYNTSTLHAELEMSPFGFYPFKFQMYFSLHNSSSGVPTKLPGGTWNCSDPQHRAVLLHHLACDLEVQCHDAEDEDSCAYISGSCGPGYLAFGEACVSFVRRRGLVTSGLAASELCEARGHRLPSFTHTVNLGDLKRLLPVPDRDYVDVYVGLRHSGRICPKIRISRLGSFKKIEGIDISTPCNIPSRKVGLVCQEPRPARATQKSVLVADDNDLAPPAPFAHVLCPGGHHTHQFLACDVNSDCWARHHTHQFLACDVNSDCWARHHTHQFLACDVNSDCWARHHTHQFLAGDVNSDCWARDFSSSSPCASSSSLMTPLPPSFACAERVQRVPYTLVCDHRRDCADGSDEEFCRLPDCTSVQPFQCGSKQVCDGWGDCLNGEDEDQCGATDLRDDVILPGAWEIVRLQEGRLVSQPLNDTIRDGTCPRSHFRCPDDARRCLPVFLRCNDVFDCPGHEDELDCGQYKCLGFYRCRGARLCLHRADLCDGHPHCPQHDDELMCSTTCPPVCACRGLAFFCRRSFAASSYPLLRYLDASGSALTPSDLTGNRLLVHLALARCGLERLDGLSLPNLLTLDAEANGLTGISRLDLVGVPQLRELSLAGNALGAVFGDVGHQPSAPFQLRRLDLSRVELGELNVTLLSASFPDLRVLNLSHGGLQRVLGEEGFRSLEQLRVVDLRGCPMTWISRGVFTKLRHLQTVYAHTFRVCCPAVLPDNFNLHDCFAPSDEISSCDNLLRANVYSVCIFVLSLLSGLGNAVSVVFRTYLLKRDTKLGYGNFVTHLSVSDFLMGVYLAIIGVADRLYRDTYLWNEVIWKRSATCKFAGFLSLLSSEVSALIVCLITLDRFLVLRFPFSRLYFQPGSAHVASVAVWCVGVVLASVPLLPVTSQWEFYSQTGICIPLPITGTDFAGHDFSFSIIIILNFVVFVFISFGQFSIYFSVRANSVSVSSTSKKTKDVTIARRLITVALTDFLCWFPIGVLGLMASNGVPIRGDVNVAAAIFVLPLNSAVNPCLYSFNVILECRGRAREEKIRSLLLAQLKQRD